jgi:hypothetical protein
LFLALTGRGYYRHWHELESCAYERDRAAYRTRRQEDIRLWLEETPGNYMVKNVREMLETRR